MKILFVSNGLLGTDNYPFPNQGGSVQTWGGSLELARRGNEVFIVRQGITKGAEIFENIHLISVKFKGMESIIRTRFMSLPFHITRICSSFYFSIKSLIPIQRISPDIICLTDRFSGIFLAGLNIPKVYSVHVAEALDFFKPYAIHANKLNSIICYIKKCGKQDYAKVRQSSYPQ